MDTRQRSFFNQDHSTLTRKRPWRSINPYYRRDQPRDERITLAKPPIRASSLSRKGLRAFAYQEPADLAMVDIHARYHAANKENAGRPEDAVYSSNAKEQRRGAKGADSPRQTNTPRAPSKKLVPPTPGITFDDLFDQGDQREVTPPKSTPRDQVVWERTTLRSSQLQLLTPTARRGVKRPRSESPSSSPHESERRIPETLNKSMHSLGANTPLRTPRYDPGPDLWQRYARNNIFTPSRPPATARADMVHSSPQEPFTSDSRAWKRSTSDLTHTARKRRRVAARQRTVINHASSTRTPSGSDTNPCITNLLEKLKEVTDETTHSGLQINPLSLQPSSSSPLPAKTNTQSADPVPSQQLAEMLMSDELDDRICEASAGATHQREPAKLGVAVGDGDRSQPLNQNPSVSSPSGSDAQIKMPSMIGTRERAANLTFSDFDIGDDDLLSTCLAAERASTAQANSGARPRPALNFHDSKNIQWEGGQPTAVGESFADHDTPRLDSGQPLPVADHDEFLLDEFDDDDIAGIDLAMSRYSKQDDQAMNTRGPLLRVRNQNDTTNETIEDKLSQPTSYGGQNNPVDLVHDEFEEEDIEDVFAELISEQGRRGVSVSSKNVLQNKIKTIQRYLVESVDDGQYQTENGFDREKVVLVKEEKSGTARVILLRDAWLDSPCSPGSYIHVLGHFDRAGQCIINKTQGIIILHPDHLISATVVADSFSCMRRAVLQDRVKATSEANEPLVYGSILHEVFQEALAADRWDTLYIEQVILTVCQRHLESLFEINVEVDQAVDRLREKASQLQSWAQIYVLPRPAPNSAVKNIDGSTTLLSINKLLDVEEHIWSPMFGLKGNVDATVQVSMLDGGISRTVTVPFELKTGRNSSNASHRAQTALYTLLMSDRYDIEVTYGILYYMETSEMSRIPGLRHELVQMIKQRNELACFVRHRSKLPQMLKNERLCGRCYAQPSCFTYHKLVEDGDGETSGLKELFLEKTQHLLPQHQTFLRKWDELLTKEEGDLMRFKRELWTMTSAERQRVGRCFAQVIIEPDTAGELSGAQKINRFRYSFIRDRHTSFYSFAESQIGTGDPIVISDEAGHYALANGYVTNIRKDRVTVVVDRRLHNARTRSDDFDAETNQSFAGIMDISRHRSAAAQVTKDPPQPIVYRIDKDEFSNGMATVRNNLIRLMEKDLFGSQVLRRLIIDKVAPIQRTHPIPVQVNETQADLNVDQMAAINKVMGAKDYALILGMPGTGKTTTIAHIIRTLTAQGKSVLLTSYTHTAVDNILLKIRKDNISILRIGTLAKVHPEVSEFADVTSERKASFDEIRRSYNSQIVATTCLGINHPVFNQRIFDYCIVDEASQITLPVCLGPIRMARTFILVGDHYQLPPLVQNKEAIEGGLDVSLFKYLSDANQGSVVNLEHQYRMCEPIMSLSNKLIYNGRLKCGNDKVASRRIELPSFAALDSHHYTASTLPMSQAAICPGAKANQCWLRDALDPSSPVLFLNTDGLGDFAKEQAKGSRIVNELEVALTTQLVRALLTAGVSPSEIGVITLYRSQLALMRHELKARSSAANTGPAVASAVAEVEMHTADKYQGRDKEAIVLSLVRSNDVNNVGDLLKDWRRVNVALTRARTKMVILGSWKTISAGNALLGDLCQMIEERGWRYDLKKGAAEAHYFEDLLTQASGALVQAEQNSPVKKPEVDSAPRRSKGHQTTLDKENLKPPCGNRNPPYKRPTLRKPGKMVTAGCATILNKRPVLRNIVAEVAEADMTFGGLLD